MFTIPNHKPKTIKKLPRRVSKLKNDRFTRRRSNWRKPKTIDMRARRRLKGLNSLQSRALERNMKMTRGFPVLVRKLLYYNIVELKKLLLENIKLRVRIARIILEQGKLLLERAQ